MTALRMLLCFIFWMTTTTFACTDFRMAAKDGTVVITRSMEFGLDMRSNLRTSNRGRVFTTTAPDGKPGLTWKGRYGYLFLDGFDQDVAIDGMNEKGLSFEALYLPGNAQYQTLPVGANNRALPYINIGDWVLSNFDNVEQVRRALPSIIVYAQKIPGMGDVVFPLHFSIYEASGKGIVVEYVAGKLNIYDNTLGVLTNSPTYDWQLTNLVNYIHLTPQNPAPIMANGITFAATGQGYGMVGIPGDISPPSRFVKIATMLRVILPPDNAMGALNMAEHVINNVDIPLGYVREGEKGDYTNETTQWVVFKDLTHRQFYYRTYGNLALRFVGLDKINFAENAARLKMPIASAEYLQDMSGQFSQAVQPVVAPLTQPVGQPAATTPAA